MSVSKQALQDFAKLVKTHPAFEEVLERIQRELFDKWLVSNDDERRVIGDISHNQGLFVAEINKLFESLDEDKPINDEEHDDAE